MKKITLALIFLTTSLFSDYFAADSSPSQPKVINPTTSLNANLIFSNPINSNFVLPNLTILEIGIAGYQKLVEIDELNKDKPLSIIDFSLPSTHKRLWIIDIASGEILHHGYVSHGRNSGDLMAKSFSNVNSSYMSSLGFYKTGETYQGKHGYSLRLDGLEIGINDKARERAIVIHGADYANEDFIKTTGRLGRSLGCPALPTSEANQVIDLIKDKSLLFIFGNDDQYLLKSPILNA
ncbi:murein L,D-transpeptidase catalytic domain family protein [Belliella kenyensis]|uniref:Murein L,D-transpeptidase catalytic domain family protein n=1 Tax=Belliella kenyensis TaxID=1472724 RepID=A0ABV8EKM4_9BACT|nr:murein L,D-transpeptidase catalytic domain family protein [Belliella kenyensis]MCH7403099.1 murein L,D-transpeptidase catalytic domain family protein [Belliella kenyensis]MDN3602268.1 murein L,D-transpeptidase catalytic domain family protein [Belliella kenyensis]